MKKFDFSDEVNIRILIGILILSILCIINQYNVILFQTISEIFAVVICIGIFFVIWNSKIFIKNNFFLFLGISLFFVGVIHIVHIILYSSISIPIFLKSPNVHEQVRLISWYFLGASFISSFYFINKQLKTYIIISILAGITFIMLFLIYQGIFPACYTGNFRLTPFDKASSFIISILFLISIALLYIKKNAFDPAIFKFLLISIILFIITSPIYAIHKNIPEIFLFLTNSIIILAFYLLYKGIIETTLTKPYSMLFKELKENRDELETEHNFVSSIFNTVGAIVIVLNKNGQIIRINRECGIISGYSLEDIAGKYFWDVFAIPEEIWLTKNIFSKLKRGNYPNVTDNYLKTQSGEKRLVRWTDTVLLNNENIVENIIKTGIDITEQKISEKNIEDLNKQLQQNIKNLEIINQDLESFNWTISHDLKTPFNVICISVKNIVEDCKNAISEKSLKYLDIIKEEAEKGKNLVEDLLHFFTSSLKTLDIQDISIEKITKEVFKEIKISHPDRNIILNVKFMPESKGDSITIKEVLYNLILNAIKFTKNRETAIIEIGGWEKGDENCFYVKDNGVGFKMEYATKIFNILEKAHDKKEYDGSGIGLAIVYKIIKKHGGTVWAESKENEGSTFYFSLPVQ